MHKVQMNLSRFLQSSTLQTGAQTFPGGKRAPVKYNLLISASRYSLVWAISIFTHISYHSFVYMSIKRIDFFAGKCIILCV